MTCFFMASLWKTHLLLREGAAALGIELPPETMAQFQVYLQELQTWNARVNLTGLTSPRDMVIKHFLDSLTVLPYIEAAPTLADLGSGAGFPGLVLSWSGLAWPSLWWSHGGKKQPSWITW